MSFPSPVGGVPLPSDFAPSILFAILYAFLLPLVIYRVWDRRSRTTLLIGTILFSVERIVIFSLRAVQSQRTSFRLSKGQASYMQSSFGLGFIGLSADLVNILRCLLMNYTYGSEKYHESPAALTKDCYLPPPAEGAEDHPRQRFWIRRFSDFTGLAFLSATVPGIIANTNYHKSFNDEERASQIFDFRFASSGVALFLVTILFVAALWSLKYQCRPGRYRGPLAICALTCLTGTIAIFRLSVMGHTTTALDSTAPGSQNSPRSKAAFYILHVTPEWIASAILLGINVRKTFGTGLFGDWRNRDETAQDRARRERREARRAEERQTRNPVAPVPEGAFELKEPAVVRSSERLITA